MRLVSGRAGGRRHARRLGEAAQARALPGRGRGHRGRRGGLGAPQSYREAFATLARAKLIDPELATALEGWAGLRNVLTHVYTALDLDRVHGALSATEPLRRIHRVAAAALATPAGEPPDPADGTGE